METQDSSHRLGRSGPIGSNGIWLQGPIVRPLVGRGADGNLTRLWAKRRRDLAEHLDYSQPVVISYFNRLETALSLSISILLPSPRSS